LLQVPQRAPDLTPVALHLLAVDARDDRVTLLARQGKGERAKAKSAQGRGPTLVGPAPTKQRTGHQTYNQ
jgi:hypothetical protein